MESTRVNRPLVPGLDRIRSEALFDLVPDFAVKVRLERRQVRLDVWFAGDAVSRQARIGLICWRVA
jgi:hypothetical protein